MEIPALNLAVDNRCVVSLIPRKKDYCMNENIDTSIMGKSPVKYLAPITKSFVSSLISCLSRHSTQITSTKISPLYVVLDNQMVNYFFLLLI